MRTIAELEVAGKSGTSDFDERISCWERDDGTGVDLEFSFFAEGQGQQKDSTIAKSYVSLTHEAMRLLTRAYSEKVGSPQ